MSVFRLECDSGKGRRLLTYETDLHRRDANLFRDDDGTVIVLGYPFAAEGGPRWVKPREILTAYRKGGLGFLRDLHGLFSIIIEDTPGGKHLLISGRFGGYSLFHGRFGERMVFSDSVEVIASSTPRLHLDRLGVIEFVQYGCIFGRRTHFEEIRELDPASVHTLRDGPKLESETYWDFASFDNGGTGDIDRLAALFTDHVRDAFSLSENPSLPLTAGFDSRAILSACIPMKDRVSCHTFGNPWNNDTRVAREVCGAIEVTHRVYPVGPGEVERAILDIDEVSSLLNGLLNPLLFAPQLYSYQMQSEISDLILAGSGGEVLRGFFYPPEIDEGADPDRVVRKAMETISVNRMPGLLNEIDGEAADDLLFESLRGHASDFAGKSAFFVAESLYLYQRMPHFASRYLSVAGRYMKLWAPWVHTPMLEFVPSLDPAAKADSAVHRRIIERNSAALSRIPVNGRMTVPVDRIPPGLRARTAWFEVEDFARKVVNKLSRGTIRREPIRPNYAYDMTAALSRSGRGCFNMALPEEDHLLSGTVNPAVFSRALDSIFRGHTGRCYVVTNVLCAQRWLRQISKLSDISSG